MIDYEAIAISAGVVWNEEDKFLMGHMARVLMVDGDGFFHPCTCPIGAPHDALQPEPNPDSSEPPQYIPLPDVPLPDPLNPIPTDPPVSLDPTTEGV